MSPLREGILAPRAGEDVNFLLSTHFGDRIHASLSPWSY